MQDFLKSKIIIFFGLFGFILSMLLCLISGTSILLILIKSIAGGLILGVIGAGLDFFLKQTLSQEDYESWFSVNQSIKEIKPETSPVEHKIDLTEDINQNTESVYQDLYKNSSNDATDNDYRGPIPDESSETHQTSQAYSYENPPEQKATPEINSNEIPPYSENINAKPSASLNEDLNRLNEVNKEEKIKKESRLNSLSHESVTFKLKNKVINADPAVVAKAIKTILHKE